MASTRRKAAAAGLAVIGIAGLSLAAAANLTVNSNTLQAGSDLDVTCQDDPVTVSYETAASAAGYNVTKVSIAGFESTCVGKDIKVTLVGPGTEVSDVVAATTEITGLTVPAGTLTGIAVVVSG